MISPRFIVSKSAFSLLELLITMALIAVMLVLGVSFMGKIREQGDNSRCVANLRQVGVAILHAAGENGGVIKFHRYNQYGNPTTMRWNDFLIQGRYLNAKNNVDACPAVRRGLPTGGGYVYGGFGEVLPGDPYSSTIEGMAASRAIRLATVEQPSKYWLLGDTWSTQHNNQIYIVGPVASSVWRVQMRHNNKANLLFADGHVAAMGLSETRELPVNPITRAFNAAAQSIQ